MRQWVLASLSLSTVAAFSTPRSYHSSTGIGRRQNLNSPLFVQSQQKISLPKSNLPIGPTAEAFGDYDDGNYDDRLRTAYKEWCQQHNKEYDEARLEIFSYHYLLAHKMKPPGGSTKDIKLDEYADRTASELQTLQGSHIHNHNHNQHNGVNGAVAKAGNVFSGQIFPELKVTATNNHNHNNGHSQVAANGKSSEEEKITVGVKEMTNIGSQFSYFPTSMTIPVVDTQDETNQESITTPTTTSDDNNKTVPSKKAATSSSYLDSLSGTTSTTTTATTASGGVEEIVASEEASSSSFLEKFYRSQDEYANSMHDRNNRLREGFESHISKESIEAKFEYTTGQIQKLKLERDEVEARYKDVKATKEETEERLLDIDKRTIEILEDNTNLKSVVGSQSETLQDSVEVLRQQLKEAEASRLDAEKRHREAQETLLKLSSELKVSDDKTQQEQKTGWFNFNNNRDQQQGADDESRVKELEEKLQTISSSKVDLEKKHEQAQNVISKLLLEGRESSNTVALLQREKAQFENLLKEAKAEVKSKTIQWQRPDQKHDDNNPILYFFNNDDAEKEARRLKTLLEDSRQRLDEAEQMVSLLKVETIVSADTVEKLRREKAEMEIVVRDTIRNTQSMVEQMQNELQLAKKQADEAVTRLENEKRQLEEKLEIVVASSLKDRVERQKAEYKSKDTEARLKQMELRLLDMEASKVDMDVNYGLAQQEIANLKAESLAADDALSTLQREKSEAEELLKNSQKEVNAIEMKLQEEIEEVKRFAGERSARLLEEKRIAEEEKIRMQREVEQKDAQLQDLRDRLTIAENARKDVEARLKKALHVISSLEVEATSSADTVMKLKREKAKLEDLLEHSNKDTQLINSQLEREVSQLKQEKQTSEERRLKAEGNIHKKELRLQELELRLQEAEKLISNLKDASTLSTDSVSNMKKEKSAVEVMLMEARKETLLTRGRLQNEIDELKRLAKAEVTKLTEEKQIAEEARLKAEDESAKRQRRLEDLESRLYRIESSRMDTETKLEEASQAISFLNVQSVLAADKISKLEQEKTRLGGLLTDSQDELWSTKTSLQCHIDETMKQTEEMKLRLKAENREAIDAAVNEANRAKEDARLAEAHRLLEEKRAKYANDEKTALEARLTAMENNLKGKDLEQSRIEQEKLKAEAAAMKEAGLRETLESMLKSSDEEKRVWKETRLAEMEARLKEAEEEVRNAREKLRLSQAAEEERRAEEETMEYIRKKAENASKFLEQGRLEEINALRRKVMEEEDARRKIEQEVQLRSEYEAMLQIELESMKVTEMQRRVEARVFEEKERERIERMVEKARLEAENRILDEIRSAREGQTKQTFGQGNDVGDNRQQLEEKRRANEARIEEERRIAEDARKQEGARIALEQEKVEAEKKKKEQARLKAGKREPRYNAEGQLVPPPYTYFAKVKAAELGVDLMSVWGSGPDGQIGVSDVIEHAAAFSEGDLQPVADAKEAVAAVAAALKSSDGGSGGYGSSQNRGSDASKSPGIVPFSVTKKIVEDMSRKADGEVNGNLNPDFGQASSSDWAIANGGLPPGSSSMGVASSSADASKSPGYVPFSVTENLARDLAKNFASGDYQRQPRGESQGLVQSGPSEMAGGMGSTERGSYSTASEIPAAPSLSASEAARSPGMVPFSMTDYLAKDMVKNMSGASLGGSADEARSYQSKAEMQAGPPLSNQEAARSPGMVSFSVTPNLAEKSRRVFETPVPDKFQPENTKTDISDVPKLSDEDTNRSHGTDLLSAASKQPEAANGKTANVGSIPTRNGKANVEQNEHSLGGLNGANSSHNSHGSGPSQANGKVEHAKPETMSQDANQISVASEDAAHSSAGHDANDKLDFAKALKEGLNHFLHPKANGKSNGKTITVKNVKGTESASPTKLAPHFVKALATDERRDSSGTGGMGKDLTP